MKERYFFDLPIYRCDSEKYKLEVDRAVRKAKSNIEKSGGAKEEDAPQTYERVVSRVELDYGAWQYNQIVGWLRLYVGSSFIGGHLWWVNYKRISYKIKYKRFMLVTSSNQLATYFPIDMTSATIYQELIQDLNEFSKAMADKGRYLDLTQFNMVAPYIDWHDLLYKIK